MAIFGERRAKRRGQPLVVGHAPPCRPRPRSVSRPGSARESGGWRATDRRKAGEPGPQPVFVLVAPQMGENIGAAARAMLNFGLDRLRLVAPRDGWPNPRAEAMASGAARVLEPARVSTAPPPSLRRPDRRPRHHRPRPGADQAGADAGAGDGRGAGAGRGGRAGRRALRARARRARQRRRRAGERGGLGADEPGLRLAEPRAVRADPRLRVDARRRRGSGRGATGSPAGGGRAGSRSTSSCAQLVERLDAVGFFFPENKRARMVANLDNLFRRAPLTDADVRTLHGVVRALARPPSGRRSALRLETLKATRPGTQPMQSQAGAHSTQLHIPSIPKGSMHRERISTSVKARAVASTPFCRGV